jgi:hypothetical protein
MRFHHSFLIAGLVQFLVITGCSTTTTDRAGNSDRSPDPAQESAYTLLQDVQSNVLREAFETRATTRYLRRAETRQMDPKTGQRVASIEQLTRYDPTDNGSTTVVEADSSGRFKLGLLSRLIRPSSRPDIGQNPVPHILPDDPAYLSERGPSLYQYELLADSSIAGRSVTVARVSVSPEATDDQQVRTARFYVDQATNELVGVILHRRQQALLFSEETTIEVYLQRIGSDHWFPERTSYRTKLDIPFLSAKQLETDMHYFTR